ncbi:unnamed protein product [Paramecium sonneborni]|uniref:Uncharacterized protein n=1 Tax=Paramecium sonneborni TaxID=65129 RepID=A0A8S1Q7H1_9CILI|nr:unnamed protein product [Paramecium sonneborni]
MILQQKQIQMSNQTLIIFQKDSNSKDLKKGKKKNNRVDLKQYRSFTIYQVQVEKIQIQYLTQQKANQQWQKIIQTCDNIKQLIFIFNLEIIGQQIKRCSLSFLSRYSNSQS